MAYIFTRHITVTRGAEDDGPKRVDESHCFYRGHLFASITFGLERRGTGGERLVNSSDVSLLGGFGSTRGRAERAVQTEIKTRGESTVERAFDIDQSDSVEWHAAAPYRCESKFSRFPDDK